MKAVLSLKFFKLENVVTLECFKSRVIWLLFRDAIWKALTLSFFFKKKKKTGEKKAAGSTENTT